MPLDPNANVKVSKALVLLEQAQNTLYHAAQELCSVDGFAPEWNKLCKAGDNAKALWHSLEAKRLKHQPRPDRVREAAAQAAARSEPTEAQNAKP